MQSVILMVFACGTAMVLSAPSPQLSNAQLDRSLTDKATMQRYLRCATGEGPCDRVGTRMRVLAPLVLRGSCPQCTLQEAWQIRRTLAHVQRNYPREWAKIIRQYG